METYIINMEKDNIIFNDSLNNIEFNPKTFLLILALTTTFDKVRKVMINILENEIL